MNAKRAKLIKPDNQASIPLGPRWLLPTNHFNLMYWLAAGLILPEGAMTKYYDDCLKVVPGWIPLFRDSIPLSTVDGVNAGLGIPVLLDIDLKQVSGHVYVLASSGTITEHQFPEAIPDDVAAILLPAPLPANLIRRVVLNSKTDKDRYLLRREELSNVPMGGFPIDIGEFPYSMNQGWPPVQAVPQRLLAQGDRVLREGAVIALVYALGNLSDAAVAASRTAFDEQSESLFIEGSHFRNTVDQVLGAGVKRETAEVRSRLFWGVVDRIVAPPVIDGRQSEPNYAVIDYLEQQGKGDQSTGRFLIDLVTDLRNSLGLAGSTARELFEKHPGPLSHALLLFFLRKHSDELLGFDTPGVHLTDADKLAAAVLFGIRDGWLHLPRDVREVPGLYDAIVHRMAASAHRGIEGGIDLGISPRRSLPLRELLTPVDGKLSSKQQEAALLLARACKWDDAIETRIRLGKGNYQLDVTPSGLQLVLPGEVKAVEIVVIIDTLLQHLADQWQLPVKLETDVRRLIES
jgi:hypothetical protein